MGRKKDMALILGFGVNADVIKMEELKRWKFGRSTSVQLKTPCADEPLTLSSAKISVVVKTYQVF